MQKKLRARTHVSVSLTFMMIFFVLSSCSGADPIIYQLEVRLQAYWDYPYEIEERLLVQIYADDEDGFDEIYEVYIINDSDEIYWRGTRDDWDVVVDTDNKSWIVLSDILSERHRFIPRGDYRIVLLDYSGFRTEQDFEVRDPFFQYSRNFFPVLLSQESNIYTPILNAPGDDNPRIYVELAYPDVTLDAAGNEKIDEYQRDIALLGLDGQFYQIDANAPIKFVLNERARIYVYLHYLSPENMLFSTGPFEINFERLVN